MSGDTVGGVDPGCGRAPGLAGLSGSLMIQLMTLQLFTQGNYNCAGYEERDLP